MSKETYNNVLRKAPFDSDRPAIEELIKQGYSDAKIAKKYKVTKGTIWCRRKRWGLESSWELAENTLKDSLAELWKNGYTVEEMADTLDLELQMLYLKMRQYKIRELPRMGVDGPSMSLTELRQSFTNKSLDDETVVLVTHNRTPKWALVPIEQYQDLASGVFQELRSEAAE